MAEWYDKFKVGQEVRVVKKVASWKVGGQTTKWNIAGDMDITIGKIYKIKQIGKRVGFQLWTEKDVKYKCNYWYPVNALQVLVGRQLLFNFMTK